MIIVYGLFNGKVSILWDACNRNHCTALMQTSWLMPIMSASGDGHQRNKIRKNLYYNTATGSARNGCFEFKDAVQQDNEYAYDANGNLTKDLNKGIAGISYNCLNLPGAVTFIDGNRITYTYAADGTKLRTVHGIGGASTTTDYCTNVIYENGTAKFLLTEKGYVSLNNLRYHYYLKDHQGNVRMTIYRDETAQKWRVEETTATILSEVYLRVLRMFSLTSIMVRSMMRIRA